ncbi:acyl-CoA N-acyltransferase [Boeremia exigua]|uniref:acyl-CoA N-acyltransferase n=1 Tax=Boeremia exigua TaxID=749465 RepID=UPI001E8D501F|nr:acyl-CoA N-acyltransferase [Boeremia exigua]KAH6633264.1 acyl-CoA N-acyltransferase [Boeremia exigua]
MATRHASPSPALHATRRGPTPSALPSTLPSALPSASASACSTPLSTPSPLSPWRIEHTTPATLHDASRFVNASRRILFPSLGHDALLDAPGVLERGCVLVAREAGGGAVVAAIAYVPFDYRFAQLPAPLGGGSASSSSSSLDTCPDRECRTVEVIRLFVLPQYRRHGLAASLFHALRDHALASGVQCMYLHTHPFLAGAIRFWEKQGFDIICVDDEDEVWQTHHMSMMLRHDTPRAT